MHRFLTVGYVYLKFVTLCMVGSTILLFLTALAIKDIKTFLIVIIVCIAGYLIVRMEIKDKRRALEINARTRANPNAETEATAEILEFSKGLVAAYSPTVLFSHTDNDHIEVPAKIQTLLIGQWSIDPKVRLDLRLTLPNSATTTFSERTPPEEAAPNIAVHYLNAHRKELAEIGVYPFFVSSASSLDIIRSMNEKRTTKGWGNVIFTHHGTKNPARQVSIGFLSVRTRSWPSQLDKILHGAFEIVRGDVLDVKG